MILLQELLSSSLSPRGVIGPGGAGFAKYFFQFTQAAALHRRRHQLPPDPTHSNTFGVATTPP